MKTIIDYKTTENQGNSISTGRLLSSAVWAKSAISWNTKTSIAGMIEREEPPNEGVDSIFGRYLKSGSDRMPPKDKGSGPES